MRYLFLLLVLVAGVLLWRRAVKKASSVKDETGQEKAVSRMVECARCGVYLPLDEAVQDGEDFYCSEGHRASGRGKHQ